MKIFWYGHSCFLLTAENGTRILTDPFDDTIGYKLGSVEAEIVTKSHDHHDHNNLSAVAGKPDIIATAGEHISHGIRIQGFDSFHDDAGGEKRGKNIVFVYEVDGLRLAHLGDLGCMLPPETIAAMGKIDVLFAPVGGVYTIGPRTACDIANATNANVLIPMHFQTPGLKLGKPILGVDTLLNIARNCSIHKLNQSECSITRENLGIDRLLVLTPALDS